MLALALYFLLAISSLILFRRIVRKYKRKNICGRLALVTGGARGLGENICIQLAKEGCNIAFCDISSCESTLEKLKPFNVKVKAYKTDVSNFNEIKKLRDDVQHDFGCDVDILVNNAGLIPYKSIFEQSYEEIQQLTAVNINSVYMMTKCFLERMKFNKNGGHIVSISSTQGIYAFPYAILYASTKFAVTGFMLSLKEFLRRQKLTNIHTTTIFPQVIGTRKDLLDMMNLKIILKPDETASVIVNAIIHCDDFVALPSNRSYIIAIFNCLPFWLQHLIRDYVMEEATYMREQSDLLKN